jgi:hypothetical protein
MTNVVNVPGHHGNIDNQSSLLNRLNPLSSRIRIRIKKNVHAYAREIINQFFFSRFSSENIINFINSKLISFNS